MADIEGSISTESLEEELTKSLAEVLYLQPSDVGVDDKFIDMGLDSILGVEWVSSIEKQYGVCSKGHKDL